MSVPSVWGNVADWMRMVARDLNPITQGYPFVQLDADPDSPTAGFTYFSTSLKKVRTWTGTSWQNHW